MDAKGEGRTLKALRAMAVPHSRELNALSGWKASAEEIPGGVRLRVTSEVKGEAVRIQALGFFGLMASGGHHQPHHLGMAKGMQVHGN